jgi:hypothetical protein
MNIQDTGIRGYLKWLKADQPGIYRAIAPHVTQLAPDAFSNMEQSHAMGALMGMGDGTTTTFDSTDFWGNPTTVVAPTTTDVAAAANDGTSTPSITSTISNLVGAVGQIFLAKNQVDTLKQVNDIQLQRAQAGLPPLNTSSLSLGVPTVQVGLSKSTMTGAGIAVGLAALLGLGFLMSRRRA